MNNRLAVVSADRILVYEGRKHIATFEVEPGSQPTEKEIEEVRVDPQLTPSRRWLTFDQETAAQCAEGILDIERHYLVARHLNPDMTREQFDAHWADFQARKAAGQLEGQPTP